MLLLAFGAFFFIGISAILARALAATGAERAKALDVARAEARGDAAAVLRMTPRLQQGRRLPRGHAARSPAGSSGRARWRSCATTRRCSSR